MERRINLDRGVGIGYGFGCMSSGTDCRGDPDPFVKLP